MGIHVGDDESFVTSADLPDDGDPADAASVNVAFEPTLDGLAYIKSRVLTFTPINAVPAYAYGQKIPLNALANNNWTEEVHAATEYTHDGWYQTTNTGAERIVFNINPPHALARLQYVAVRLDGNGHAGAGAHGAVPGTPPIMRVYRVDDGAPSLLESWTEDPAITQPQYDAPHTVPSGLIDEDPLPIGSRLELQVFGEAGANSQANSLLIIDAVAIWTSDDTP